MSMLFQKWYASDTMLMRSKDKPKEKYWILAGLCP